MTERLEARVDTAGPAPDSGRDGAEGVAGVEGGEARAGNHAVAVARAHGVQTTFTLSGAHVFSTYDGAVTADPPMRILDVRHEQTAAFAAEAAGKLTGVPGLAVLTAGPGVTNGVSAAAQAQFAGSPLVVVGGRAPADRWGSGSLQELDQPPILAPVSKLARTIHTADDVADGIDEAFRVAGSSHCGPVLVDVPMDAFFDTATVTRPVVGPHERQEPDPDGVAAVARLLGEARRPVLVLGTDVWADGAEDAALRLVEETGLPTITNGMGHGPYGCLGAGMGGAIAARLARPSAQVVPLYGDGAAGMSLMDVDTLVRHDLPVVMVCGNNGAWGLEKGPMQMLYGYDVAADLAPATRYDDVVRTLGGGGETVTDPRQIGPALDRAFASGVPYLVNVVTDVEAAYPPNTFGM